MWPQRCAKWKHQLVIDSLVSLVSIGLQHPTLKSHKGVVYPEGFLTQAGVGFYRSRYRTGVKAAATQLTEREGFIKIYLTIPAVLEMNGWPFSAQNVLLCGAVVDCCVWTNYYMQQQHKCVLSSLSLLSTKCVIHKLWHMKTFLKF